MGQISVDYHSHSILLWRQLTQWIGGMGIIVLMVAILSELSVGGAQVMNKEAPGLQHRQAHAPDTGDCAGAVDYLRRVHSRCGGGILRPRRNRLRAEHGPVQRRRARADDDADRWLLPEARSVEAFSPAIQWAVMPFMLVAGTNFALFWYVLNGEPRRLTGNKEFRSYVLAVAAVGGLVAVLLYTGLGLAELPSNIDVLPGNLENSLRQALFQSLAIVTTTGYASMDFNTWDESARVLLFAMFLGGSAGSAAGSIKIVRWYVVQKTMARGCSRPSTPTRSARSGWPRAGRRGDDQGIFVFVMVFVTLFGVSTILLFLDGLRTGMDLSAIEATSAAIATLGNIGPGFGVVGPMNSFEPFSDGAKLYMVFLMWIGRLEILSVLVIFTPNFWQR